MRFTRLAVALVFALAACGGPAGDGGAGGTGRYGGGLPGEESSSPPAARSPSPNGSRQAPGPGAPRETAAGIPGASGGAAYFDDGGVGAMAHRYLQPSPARLLIVEIDYVAGRRPTTQATSHIRAILERETRKDVRIDIDDEIPGNEGVYSFDEIDQMEGRHRDARSGGDTATMWVVYLDGNLKDEAGTVGVAIRASMAAIFYDHIRDASTAVVGADQIERAVLTHEIGHLLALVNIGYRSRHDHEDPESPGHSRYRSSVMYAQIEDKGLVALITGGPAEDFDRYDRDDLAMLRAA